MDNIPVELRADFDPIAGIDFKSGVDGLFDAVKTITNDYNEKIVQQVKCDLFDCFLEDVTLKRNLVRAPEASNPIVG